MHPVSIIILILIVLGMSMMWKGNYPVTGVLVLTNIAVFFIQWMYSNISGGAEFFDDLGFRAEYLTNGSNPWTILSNLFIHGGFLHILGNMLFLTLLGMPFEDRIGSRRFAIIYFSTGILANVFHGSATLIMYGSGSAEADTVGVGASGAIFGIMGAFAILYPRDEIPMILGPIFLQRVPVYIAAMSYALFEIFAVHLSPGDHIGHIAHVGGFITGVFIGPALARAPEKKAARLDYSLLEELLESRDNIGLENAVKNLKSTDIKEVREAWWEDLLKKARCPRCGSGLGEGRHGLVCEKCGYALDLRKRK